MATETRSIGPAAKDFMQAARAQAGGPPPPAPKTPPASSGNSGTGDGNSGSSGGTGGGGGKSGGGGENHPPNHGKSSQASDGFSLKMDARRWIILLFMAITSGCIVYYTMWRTTPAGQKVQAQENSLDEQRIKLARDKEQVKMMRIAAKSGAKMPAVSNGASTCLTLADSAGISRSTAFELSFGQCASFTATGARQTFWVNLNSAPKEINGKASFNNLREERADEKIARRERCLAKTSDAEFCEKEMQRQRGVRLDEGCITQSSPDLCLGYLKNRTSTPLIVHTDESINIVMN